MAELTAFAFRPGRSWVHRLDARIKMACVVMISLAALHAGPYELAGLSAAVGWAMFRAHIPLVSFFRQLRLFILLLLVVFFLRALAFGQPVDAGFSLFGVVTMTTRGTMDGALVCWRLVLVVLTGNLFAVTTRQNDIKAAVQWGLAPIPLVPEKRVALMLGLIVRFIPRVLRQAGEIMDAQRARCVEKRKHPVYRAEKFIVPLARKTFEDADKLATAMEARCYQAHRTDPHLSAGPMDWAVFVVASMGFIFVVLV